MTQWKDPQIGPLREAMAAQQSITGPELSFAERRAGIDAFGTAAPMPEGVTVETVTIGGRPGERIKPTGAAAVRTLLYLHGGGYCIGSPLSHRALVSRLALATGATAWVPDYRMGPEDPFPAAVDDGLAAYRQLLDGGADPAKTFIAGDSAGGGLTFATALAIRDAGLKAPAALLAISPWTDLTQSGMAHLVKIDSDPMVTKPALDDFAAAYLGEAPGKTPLASPMFADLKDLPPVLIQVGGEEALLSDSTGMAEAIGLAGGDVTLRIWPEMIHVWHFFAPQLTAAQRAIDEASGWVKSRVG
jgi:monoterpene epsilon-lactone hydrolase